MMVNKNKNKINQPPTGEGKKQSTQFGEPHKLDKRSEVLQSSQRQQNIGSAEEEDRSEREKNPKRTKAGR
jgi:hypothetical protein